MLIGIANGKIITTMISPTTLKKLKETDSIDYQGDKNLALFAIFI